MTIACGAISGFHSLVASGTTPKMLDKETDARFIGYGAMAAESLVGLLALIAASSMYPGDYFAINSAPEVFSRLGLHTVNLDLLLGEVGENLTGRTGGAVSPAVGMAEIFKRLPGMERLVGYWYHFAIMFEALFISVAHIYNLRKSRMNRLRRMHFEKTRPVTVGIGERRRPDPQGRPGYIRIDTVHQGDLDGVKGVYHIHAVDEVTQWQIVGATAQIAKPGCCQCSSPCWRSSPFS